MRQEKMGMGSTPTERGEIKCFLTLLSSISQLWHLLKIHIPVFHPGLTDSVSKGGAQQSPLAIVMISQLGKYYKYLGGKRRPHGAQCLAGPK